ncbi:MAG TPA: rod shape-determining protein RodA [Chthonomonadaceae bacterium]|nr:rod shape-determining protein RodA [Chthonomonadaceae bacterium]
MLSARLRKNLDVPLLALTYLIAALGVIVIFSATRGDPTPFYKKQILWMAVGTVGLAAAAFIDYHHYARFSRHLYALNLLLLALVSSGKLSHAAKGAARWINIGGFQLQPSEFAKLFLIITLAVFLAKRHESIKQGKTLLLSFLYIAVPVALIFKQPDLGTALVILAIWFGMIYMAGARILHLIAILLAGVLLFTGLWYSGKLKDYQKNRLISFVNPEADPKETGYHVLQARIAIGSGGMWGKGLGHSTQVRGGYVPEKQTDFIFTDVGEELGFVGSVTVTLLYAALLLRGVFIIAAADEDILGKLMATGVVTMFAFHVIVNIGMNIGIMPVAGVPLLFFSYGGSNMIVALASIGLLQSIAMHRHQLLF